MVRFGRFGTARYGMEHSSANAPVPVDVTKTAAGKTVPVPQLTAEIGGASCFLTRTPTPLEHLDFYELHSRFVHVQLGFFITFFNCGGTSSLGHSFMTDVHQSAEVGSRVLQTCAT